MALSNGYIKDAKARGKAARFQHKDTGLVVQYDDHEEIIEDRCIIAVIPRRKPDQGEGEYDKTVTILLLRANGPSLDECHFESIGK